MQGQGPAGYTHLFSHNSAILDEGDTCGEWQGEDTLITLLSFHLEAVSQFLAYKAIEEAQQICFCLKATLPSSW